MYKCKYCGKSFKLKQQLGGHVRRCKYNPKYTEIIENWKKSILNKPHNFDNKTNKDNNKDNKDNKKQILYCQYCEKECKNLNSLRQHEIRCKNNPNKILSYFMTDYNKIRIPTNQYIKAKREGRTIEISEETRNKLRKINCNRKISEETKRKISNARKQYLNEHPEKIPFKLNHSSKQSYPEQYFENLFLQENIPLQYHKQIHRYELDFYNENLMKYVEIDGEQHYSPYMIQHDIERTKYLENLGWKGIRIRWTEFKQMSFEEKQNKIKEIKEFLELI